MFLFQIHTFDSIFNCKIDLADTRLISSKWGPCLHFPFRCQYFTLSSATPLLVTWEAQEVEDLPSWWQQGLSCSLGCFCSIPSWGLISQLHSGTSLVGVVPICHWAAEDAHEHFLFMWLAGTLARGGGARGRNAQENFLTPAVCGRWNVMNSWAWALAVH